MHTLHLHPFLDKKRREVDLPFAGCNLALPVSEPVSESEGSKNFTFNFKLKLKFKLTPGPGPAHHDCRDLQASLTSSFRVRVSDSESVSSLSTRSSTEISLFFLPQLLHTWVWVAGLRRVRWSQSSAAQTRTPSRKCQCQWRVPQLELGGSIPSQLEVPSPLAVLRVRVTGSLRLRVTADSESARESTRAVTSRSRPRAADSDFHVEFKFINWARVHLKLENREWHSTSQFEPAREISRERRSHERP
jgi:hypothetical protein